MGVPSGSPFIGSPHYILSPLGWSCIVHIPQTGEERWEVGASLRCGEPVGVKNVGESSLRLVKPTYLYRYCPIPATNKRQSEGISLRLAAGEQNGDEILAIAEAVVQPFHQPERPDCDHLKNPSTVVQQCALRVPF